MDSCDVLCDIFMVHNRNDITTASQLMMRSDMHSSVFQGSQCLCIAMASHNVCEQIDTHRVDIIKAFLNQVITNA